MKKLEKKYSKFLCFFLSILMFLSLISLPSIKTKAEGTLDDFVERCYTVTLDRPSDADGFADWKNKLLNGKAVGFEIAYGFMFSKEYLAKDKDNDEYLHDLYSLFMGREPDESGYNDWMGKLNDGASRLEVFAGFANSPEFYNLCKEYDITAGRYVKEYDRDTNNNVNLFVERMYKICLGRIGDKDGQKNWAEKLIKGEITGTECARNFIFSKEYTNKNLSDEEFVENLYLAMFGRPSDEAGKANWLNALESGDSRDEVFAGFVNSPEFDNVCNAYGIKKTSYTASNVGKYKAGDIIKFGKYEQDGDLSNGQEDIEWQILSFKDGKMFVISKYALDCKPYNDEYTDVTWENCSLRKWLNEDFYNTAFSDDEKTQIPSVTVINNDNPVWGVITPTAPVDGGNDTTDKLFCLSIDELFKYFGEEYDYYHHNENNEYLSYGHKQNVMCTPTPYTQNKLEQGMSYITFEESFYNSYIELGINYTPDVIGTTVCNWVLRTPGGSNSYVLGISKEGIVDKSSFCTVSTECGIRPAMYIEYQN